MPDSKIGLTITGKKEAQKAGKELKLIDVLLNGANEIRQYIFEDNINSENLKKYVEIFSLNVKILKC